MAETKKYSITELTELYQANSILIEYYDNMCNLTIADNKHETYSEEVMKESMDNFKKYTKINEILLFKIKDCVDSYKLLK